MTIQNSPANFKQTPLRFRDGDPVLASYNSFLFETYRVLAERDFDRDRSISFLNRELQHNAGLRLRVVHEAVALLLQQRAAAATARPRGRPRITVVTTITTGERP
jgi:hypothetical protein